MSLITGKDKEIRNFCDFERLNYHYGQMITERDFRDQQKYYNEKRWMMNFYGIGWGILKGLQVRLKHEDTCSQTSNGQPPCIVLDSGIAIDHYGNEIYVDEEKELNLADRMKNKGHQNSEADDQDYPDKIYIGLKYCEYDTEPFRAIETHSCEIDECLYSRTKETFRIMVSEKLWPHVHEHTMYHEQTCKSGHSPDNDVPVMDVHEPFPDQQKGIIIPLAIVKNDGKLWIVDNYSIRREIYSNYHLSLLIHKLSCEVLKNCRPGSDRRSHVPLLAQTIPGVQYRDGRIRCFKNAGVRPFKITTDGLSVWFTDLKENEIHRLCTGTNSEKEIESIEVEKSAWGIAYDGKFIWITHPDNGSLSRFEVRHKHNEKSCVQLSNFEPGEIIFADNYLWIAAVKKSKREKKSDEQNVKTDSQSAEKHTHGEVHLVKFDPVSCQVVTPTVKICDHGTVSTIQTMVYDGSSIWIALENKDRDKTIILYQVDESKMSKAVEIRGCAKDITFDGTNIWAVHQEGASKIDIDEKEEVATTIDRGELSSVAFDGSMMWGVQNRDREVELKRCDIYTLEQRGGYELRSDEGKVTVERVCFDGTYLWATASIEELNNYKGVLYRLLP